MRIRIPTWYRALGVVGALFATLLIAAACGGGEKAAAPGTTTKPTIRFADNQYESLWINDALAQYIIEKGYGYPTDTVELTTQLAQVALVRGDVDVWIEMWVEYYPDWFARETAAGNIIELDAVMFQGPAFFVVPKWVADQYNIRTVEDMKRPEVVALFPDPEDPTKGLFINCAIGTQCSKINPAKLMGYGLDQYYNTLEAGSQGGHDAALVGAQKKRQPVFSYYWAPTSIMGSYDWHILEEPPYTDACWEGITKAKEDSSIRPKEACAYRTSQVTKVIHKDLPAKAPDVVEFLKKMVVETEPLSRTAAWAVENNVRDWSRAAVYYLRTYEERWKTWVTPEAYEKIRAALQAEPGGA